MNILDELATMATPLGRAARAALEHVPSHRRPRVIIDSDSPWLRVDQTPGPELVVWLETGEVFEVNADGSVGEEPLNPKRDD